MTTRNRRFGTLTTLSVALSMLLSACGGTAATPASTDAPTSAATSTSGPVAPPANSTDTPAGMSATDTPAAMMDKATATTAGGAMTSGSTFDASKVKKLDVEPNATLRISGWSSTPAELTIVQDQLARFNKVYPDIKVNYEPVSDYDTKFKAQVSAGTESDVFYVNGNLVDELINANKLLELTPFMTTAGLKKSDYYEEMINEFSRGDKVYGLPKDFGALAVFYNTDLVKSPPKDGWTWDDYKAWVKDNTTGTDSNSKVFGSMHPPDLARWIPFVLANGGTVINSDGKTTGINSPEAVAALDFYYGMFKDGTAGQPADVGAGWAGEAFGKKRTAAVIEGGWLIPYMADPKNGFQDVKYKAAPLPKSPKGKVGNLLFTNSYSASASTKFPKAAAALVMFLAGAENQREVMRSGFALPTLKNDTSGGQSMAFKDDPYFKDHPNEAVLFDATNYGSAFFYGPKQGKIQDALNQALEKVWKGNLATKAALDEAAADINDLLK